MKTTSAMMILTRPFRALLAAALLGVLAAPAAESNLPGRMSYQGYLTDANGVALGSAPGPRNYDVIFRLWSDEAGTTPTQRVWTEQQTVTVDNGLFSVVLGEGSAYASEARPSLVTAFGSDGTVAPRYLEMTVRGVGPGGTDATILPRLRLLPSPYAFLAQQALYANHLVNQGDSQVVLTVRENQVGIGTGNPTAALDVNGQVKATAVAGGDGTFSGALSAGSLSVSGHAQVGGTVTAGTFAGHGTIPIGGIIMWSGSTPPPGWALCDGGTYHGRQTPDLRGRFVLGSGNGAGLTARSIGQRGGAETHTLTTAEMPAHSHGATATTAAAGAHTHGYTSGWGSRNGIKGGNWGNGEIGWGAVNNTTTSAGSHTHEVTVNIGSTGGSEPHNNMPPYHVLAYIMRVQ
jgi:microcystin-dependent protein